MKKISSVDNDVVKHLTKLRLNRDYRHEHKSLVVSGVKPIQELPKNVKVDKVIATCESFVPTTIKAKETFIVNDAIMKKITGLQAPEGIAVEVAMPADADLKKKKSVVVLDAINDPGNMGTLLRTALALGWEGAYILDNSCDPYNEKALRAARGATFRLPMQTIHWSDFMQMIKKKEWNPVVADLNGSLPEKVKRSDKMALILSNEAHGLSEEAASLASKVSIPMQGNMESLNVAVAGGILMYLLRK